jgi:hypothetical protein
MLRTNSALNVECSNVTVHGLAIHVFGARRVPVGRLAEKGTLNTGDGEERGERFKGQRQIQITTIRPTTGN